MSTPTLLPTIQLRAEVETQLADLAENHLRAPARRAGYELQIVGTSQLPKRGEVVTIQNPITGNWLISGPDDDPTAQAYEGKHRIPENVRLRLEQLDAAGVHPDHMLIAHELPDGWQPGDDVENLIPAPSRVREHDELMRRAFKTVTELAAGAVVAPFALIAATGAGLDPVLFGGVQHPSEPVVVWAELARWSWE